MNGKSKKSKLLLWSGIGLSALLLVSLVAFYITLGDRSTREENVAKGHGTSYRPGVKFKGVAQVEATLLGTRNAPAVAEAKLKDGLIAGTKNQSLLIFDKEGSRLAEANLGENVEVVGWSPEGGRLYYRETSRREVPVEQVVRAIDFSKGSDSLFLKLPQNSFLMQDIVWHSQGSKIFMLLSNPGGDPHAGPYSLWTGNADGTDLHEVTPDHPALKPSRGGVIYPISVDDLRNRVYMGIGGVPDLASGIYSMTFDGQDFKPVAVRPPGEETFYDFPLVSVTGDLLAFAVSYVGKGSSDVYVVDLSTYSGEPINPASSANVRRFTFPYQGVSPAIPVAWSKDSRYLIVSSANPGKCESQFYLLDIKEKFTTKLNKNAGEFYMIVGHPAVWPEEARLYALDLVPCAPGSPTKGKAGLVEINPFSGNKITRASQLDAFWVSNK